MHIYFMLISILIFYGAIVYKFPVVAMITLGIILILSISIILLVVKLPSDQNEV